jgi:hypothetical protein
MKGLQIGARTTVVRLASGGLWLHSPGPLDQKLRAELSQLGPVQGLVAPNAMHHLYLSQNIHAFPEARVYLSPALPPKLKEQFSYELLQDEPPALWRNDLGQHLVAGLARLQEVVFFHPPSRTLLLTDFAFNIRHSDSWFTRFFMRLNGGYGRFGPTRIFRSLVNDRAALRVSLNRMLSWDFDRVIVTHGEVLESGGKQEVQKEYAWV